MSRLTLFLMLLSFASLGQPYALMYMETGTDASFRGISVADEHSIWVSGSKGWIGRSTDGGSTWRYSRVKGYEQCDFRSVCAFDSLTAIIANAGSPAYVLRTEDGGNTWRQVYENEDSAAFIDGIGFWPAHGHRRGLIHGDPINGRMLLLRTTNGGKRWCAIEGPLMAEGEASFAASGTSINCYGRSTVVIASGGRKANLYVSGCKGKCWRTVTTPMLSGEASKGIYSFAASREGQSWFIAGGDYRHDTISTANFFYSTNKGKQWTAPNTTTRGYRECLAIADNATDPKSGSATIVAVGPTGIDISYDHGHNWQALSNDKGFHVIKPSADGRYLYLAGANGKLAVMQVR
jgi:photosystem II stability/assembly factor-like uncharacterized protein